MFLTLVLILFVIFIFSKQPFSLSNTFLSFPTLHRFLPVIQSRFFLVSLTLSVTLSFSLSHFTYGFFFYLNFFFPFRVARFLFHSLFCVGLELPSIHDWMWRSGVSGALKGPSFQNHRSQRTHQTAYAKRKSRRRSVGNLIGEFSVDSHLLPLYLFRSRHQNCISLIRSAKKKKFNHRKQKRITISKVSKRKDTTSSPSFGNHFIYFIVLEDREGV